MREGQQDRSRKTQARLLDAAEKLFAERGIGGATITDISAAAGCSIGAFYHHYRDKQAIQFALFDRYATEFDETIRISLDPTRWQGASIGEILQGYVQVAIANDRERPERRRSGVILAQAEPELHAHLVKLRVQLDNGLRQLLRERSAEIGHPDPEVAITYVLDQVGSMLRTRLHEPTMPSRFGSHSDDQFVQETLRSVCAYLQVSLPPEH